MEKVNYSPVFTECEEEVEALLDINYFRALVEPVRMEIIKYLSVYGAKSINEIAQNFPQNRTVISRHLDHLYKQGIIQKRKESRYTIYQVDGLTIAEKLEESAKNIRAMIKKYETS